MQKVALILAGGYGSRLWPFSTESNPKQFSHFFGEGSMLVNTYQRILNFFDKQNIFVISQSIFYDKIKEQLPDLSNENIILEPYLRSTSAAITYANLYLQYAYTDNFILNVFPSDHLISNLSEFSNSLEIAQEAAESLKAILTLGIIPTYPETQFGYINIDDTIKMPGFFEKNVRFVKNFAEKPDKGTAERFIQSGDFVWNSGIFVFLSDVLWKELQINLPEFYKLFNDLKLSFASPYFARKLDHTYRSLPTISFDNGILEKSKNVFCVLSNFEWSDLESWDEVYRQAKKDIHNNFVNGEVINLQTEGVYILAKDRLVATIGVSDLIIVETEKATLICKRGETEKVKKIIDYLRSKGIKDYL
ncbi:MAG TPA: sugar phosphate nucleotidyltransferase [Candidatus Kapabacteria bacterium]|nr:sugar phosphate nucleotidyltransferase [Candidatus Kapabacteria bacterium]